MGQGRAWAGRGPLLLGALGALIVVTGLVVMLTAPQEFGWFAYQPLPPEQPLRHVVTAQSARGMALAVLGLVLLSLAVGYRFGLKHGRGEDRQHGSEAAGTAEEL